MVGRFVEYGIRRARGKSCGYVKSRPNCGKRTYGHLGTAARMAGNRERGYVYSIKRFDGRNDTSIVGQAMGVEFCGNGICARREQRSGNIQPKRNGDIRRNDFAFEI